MEPRPEGRGDDGPRRLHGGGGGASMEPRPEGRGDLVFQASRKCAPTALQWSHGPKAVETSSHRRDRGAVEGFNGATARRPWRHSPAPSLRRSRACFNGATARRPWRHATAIHAEGGAHASMEPRPEGRGDSGGKTLLKAILEASMEPRPEGRGDWRPRTSNSPDQNCFNGATARRPWRRAVGSTVVTSFCMLQWSHGPKAVETPS